MRLDEKDIDELCRRPGTRKQTVKEFFDRAEWSQEEITWARWSCQDVNVSGKWSKATKKSIKQGLDQLEYRIKQQRP